MIYDFDEWLLPYKDVIDRRHKMIMDLKERFSVDGSLSRGMNNHVFYGMHRDDKGNWVFVSGPECYQDISHRRFQQLEA